MHILICATRQTPCRKRVYCSRRLRREQEYTSKFFYYSVSVSAAVKLILESQEELTLQTLCKLCVKNVHILRVFGCISLSASENTALW